MLPFRVINAAMRAHLADNLQLPTSLHKQFGGYMGSDNLRLAYVQPPTSLQIRQLRPYKQIIWGDIRQLPLDR